MPQAIAFRSVTKRFPDGTLGLADATWHVDDKVRACLLGPSGSGKTTAIRMLQAALRPTGGSVMLLGFSVAGPAYREVRRRMGIVPQVPGMYPDLTAGEYMAFAAQLYRARRDQFDHAVEALDLTEYLNTRMTYLSSNFQRRLALAAAMVAEPDVLLLDEPTAGLDPVAAHDLRQHLRDAMKDRTCLLCTHSETDARALCDEVIRLRGGRVVAQGTWDELRRRSRPRLRVTARQGVDRLHSELTLLGYAAEVEESSVLVELTNLQQDAPAMLRKLLEAGVDVFECAPVMPSVEDILHDSAAS